MDATICIVQATMDGTRLSGGLCRNLRRIFSLGQDILFHPDSANASLAAETG